ncbi:UDP-2,4-diacetamido-2,4,6-trideoxy-beta-L-altropyranose hydrolase [Halobacillus sp. Marseille-Q1614]|uniref:UDP-2,4-diacetamido-2,4, 6-trideoxy-beta-L-altropyranose hydrolase n=1 Tax=Halobacillus sp. Marseille-Q1614 TaxID=2709134 RepID=UPI00156F7D7E|nr:UDP-2,4-diacetamido-2,4,6-trideoxy-beta-L-altropyranose hydrolase [Halobacillus sp. Marseille-Q1614]
MRIFIRTDASHTIGAGHVMRCLSLAENLRDKGADITFLCRKLPGDLNEFIKHLGFDICLLTSSPSMNQNSQSPWLYSSWKQDALETIQMIRKGNIDWLIIDHYGLDRGWERAVRPYVKYVMVIDDLANRRHDCDLLLDQNLFKHPEKRYTDLVPPHAITFCGPQYLLLREEFKNINRTKTRDGYVRRILISFGGSDPTNETLKAVRAIQFINHPDIHVDVVIGSSNPHSASIEHQCKNTPNIKIHTDIHCLAELMMQADLSIGAGGSTTWERCFVSLPSITIEVSRNQSEILSYLSELGVIYHLGMSKHVNERKIAQAIQQLITSPAQVRTMVKASRNIMKDFKHGVVAQYIMEGMEV